MVELMIVVVIVAILAMVGIPLYRSYVAGARMSEGIAGVGAIRTALRVYASAHAGDYPTLAGVDGTGLGVINVPPGDLTSKYFNAGDYEVTSDASSYTLTATDPLTAMKYQIDENGTETTGTGYYTSGH